MGKSDEKVQIWELEVTNCKVNGLFFSSFVRLFVSFEGVAERRSYETFGEDLTTLKLNDLDKSLRLIMDVEF